MSTILLLSLIVPDHIYYMSDVCLCYYVVYLINHSTSFVVYTIYVSIFYEFNALQ